MSRFRIGITNASYLAIGNIVTKIIAFLGFIYIAKWLGVEQYGVYSTVTAFVMMFPVFTLGGLGKVLIREGSKDITSLVSLYNRAVGMRILLLISAMVLCILFAFFAPYDLRIKLFIVLFSFQIFFQGIIAFLSTIYQVVEKMKYISIVNIISRIIFVLLALGFLYFGFKILTLIIISLMVNFGTLVTHYFLTRRFVKFNLFSKISFEKQLLKPAVSFSLFSVVSILSTRFDLLLISILGTPVEVGIYAVAYKILMQGQTLRNLNATAFFPVFVKRFKDGPVNGTTLLKYSLGFFFTILALSAVLSYFCTDIVVLLLGDEYTESGKILSIIIFYLAAIWGTLPFTIAAQATDNENLMLKIRTVMALSNVVLKYIFFSLYGLIGIAYCTLIIWGIGSFAMCVLPYQSMRKQGYLSPAYLSI